MQISTKKSDVIWNYIGTIVSMASGFVLLPLLMHFLTNEELGLWYVFVAVANLAMLFEFGFNPTFARNIVYVLGGAKALSFQGRCERLTGGQVDWHLLNVVIRASKFIYACIAIVVLVALVFIGSAYIAYISEGIAPRELWVSWTMFVAAIALNLYFLYSITILRGYGDVAGENIAKTFAKVFQLVLSAVLLLAGFGLVGAAFGYFTNSVLLRAIALWRVKRHREIEGSRQADAKKVTCLEIREVLKAVYHLAWRDGVVQLAYYASSQATTIMSSLYLGLAETGTYSILLQLGTAVYSFAVAYPKSFFPAMQSAFSNGDTTKQLKIVSKGVVAYWGLIVVAALGVLLVILPLLPLFKPDVVIDNLLFLGIVAYLALLQQHSVFCNYIISMNEIPYMKGYLFAAVLGVVLVYLFCAIFNWGAWGIVAGQFLSQIVYNNWKWPKYLCNKLGTTYFQVIKQGIKAWLKRG